MTSRVRSQAYSLLGRQSPVAVHIQSGWSLACGMLSRCASRPIVARKTAFYALHTSSASVLRSGQETLTMVVMESAAMHDE